MTVVLGSRRAGDGQEAVVDAVDEGVAPPGMLGEARHDGLGHALAAAENQRCIGQPRGRQIAVEIDQRMIVAVQHRPPADCAA